MWLFSAKEEVQFKILLSACLTVLQKIDHTNRRLDLKQRTFDFVTDSIIFFLKNTWIELIYYQKMPLEVRNKSRENLNIAFSNDTLFWLNYGKKQQRTFFFCQVNVSVFIALFALCFVQRRRRIFLIVRSVV